MMSHVFRTFKIGQQREKKHHWETTQDIEITWDIWKANNNASISWNLRLFDSALEIVYVGW